MSVERSVNFTEKSAFAEIFTGIPIKNDLNPKFLDALVGNQDKDDLRKKASERFATLTNMRRKLGIYDYWEIGTETAIALIDDSTYQNVVNEAKQEGKTQKVARHETGHELVASNLGWKVSSVTVVPGASYLGLTICSPKPGMDIKTWALESAAISLAGGIAAEMMGDKAEGTGADIASAYVMARILKEHFNIPEEATIGKAKSIARGALSSMGAISLERSASALLHKQTKVA